MISLDKNILLQDSLVTRRMIGYGKEKELFIIIPSRDRRTFDISETVHVQSTGGNRVVQFFRLLLIGRRLIKEKKIDEITAQDPLYVGLAGVCLKKMCGIKLEVQMHGDFLGGYYGKRWVVKMSLHNADTIRVVGERIRQSILPLGIAPEKIIVRPVNNTVEIVTSTPVDVHQAYPAYEKIFLVLGRLESVKNVLWLINVFKDAVGDKKYLLLIVGKGSQQAAVQQQVGESVVLEQWTDHPYEYIKSADCVLFSSLSEGYGLVPMEAHALGTPVIMNDVGVAHFELRPSDKVKIIPVSDREAWVQAIRSV